MSKEVNEIIAELKSLSDPEKIEAKKKKFAVVASNALGVYMKDINRYGQGDWEE